MTTSRLDPNSTRNPESVPDDHARQAGTARHGGTAPDKPAPARKQEPETPATVPSGKISDWETEGGSPPKVISSTRTTPPKKSGK